ncbi:MAG TPA: hypothetical protein VNE61_02000 [Ktedonobacteraceae bacterium]|nr:hypothetical protein [Ktedonobacteraceae bacterium]
MVTLEELQAKVAEAQEEIRSARKAPEEIKRWRLARVKHSIWPGIQHALDQCLDFNGMVERQNLETLILKALDEQTTEAAEPPQIDVKKLKGEAGNGQLLPKYLPWFLW